MTACQFSVADVALSGLDGENGEVTAEAEPLAWGWLGGVVARVLNLSHYLGVRIEDREKEIIQNYVRALDPDGLIFTRDDVDSFVGRWEGLIESDVEEGTFILAEEVVTEASRKYKQLTQQWPNLLLELDSAKPQIVDIFNHEAPHGTIEALSRFYQKGELSRGWGPAEVFQILCDYENQMLQMKRAKKIHLFLDAVAKAFDKNSAYYPKEKYNYVVSRVTLQPSGVGIELKEDGSGEVRQISNNSPAGRSGEVLVGDKLLSVTDSEGIKHESTTSASSFNELLSPEAGESVTFEVARENEDVAVITLQSENLVVSPGQKVSECSVERSGRNIGVLRIPSFYSGRDDQGGLTADSDTRERVLSMVAQEVDAIVVDVRQDSGGSVEAAVAVAGFFLNGTVYHSVDRYGGVRTFKTEGDPIYTGPLVVLVSAGTASAAEVFSKAIQDHQRGIIVGGVQTFGKGSMQTLLDLDWHGGGEHFPSKGSGSLRVTTKILFGPGGGSIQGCGIFPDITLPCVYDVARSVAIREGKAEVPAGPDKIKVDQLEDPLFWTGAGLTEVRMHSERRVDSSPYFQKVIETQEGFEHLFKDARVSLERSAYADKMAHFSTLSQLIRNVSPKKEMGADCGELDPLLDEAINIAVDLWRIEKNSGLGPAPAKEEITH